MVRYACLLSNLLSARKQQEVEEANEKNNAMKFPALSNVVCYPLGSSQMRPKPDILLPPLLLFDTSSLLTLTTGILSMNLMTHHPPENKPSNLWTNPSHCVN